MYKKDDGLRHYVQIHKGNLANKMPLTTVAATDGNEGPLEVDGLLGGIEIIARMRTAGTVADAKKLNITLHHSNASSSGFEPLGVLYDLTASGSTILAVGQVLGTFVLPSTVKRYLKVVVTPDAVINGATLDVFPSYLPR